MVWKDDFVQWNDTIGPPSMRIPAGMIWTPEVVIINSLDDMEPLGSSDSRLLVTYNGYVYWAVGISTSVTCNVDVTSFPFDSQTCHLAFLNWGLMESGAELTNRISEIDFSFFKKKGSSEWKILGSSVVATMHPTASNRTEPMVFAYIRLERRYMFHVVTSILPVVCLSILNLVVFRTPPECGEKMSMSLSILLSYGIYATIASTTLPSNSESPCLFSIYLAILISISSVSVIATHVVVVLHHKVGSCEWKKPVGLEKRTGSNETLLREALLNGYDVNIRPVRNSLSKTTVHIFVGLAHIGQLDEKAQTLTVIGYVNMIWKDDFVQWNDTIGPPSMRIPAGMIWTPEVVIINSLDGMEPLGSSDSRLMVTYNGYVSWTVGISKSVRCNVDVTSFPFDSQTCHLAFLNWGFVESGAELINTTNEIDFKFFKKKGSSEWKILGSSVVATMHPTAVNRTEPMVFAYIRLERRYMFHVVTSILPVVCLSILNLVVFRTPPECGEKMSMSVSILLSYGIYATIASTTLPSNSEFPCLFSIYLAILISISSTSVIATHIVVVMHHKVGSCEWKVFRQWSSCSTKSTNTIEAYCDESEQPKRETSLLWKDVAIILDRIFFSVFLLVTLLVTMAVFIMMAKYR
ncbi:neuronal acetylcholine receptor subunit alpha-5-like [Haliotis rubra]|uniref:neuronal acetylcholine receptor subunit alpha-5-like n=1 Tax=Haliotis rubra TaxID=36100 RepID=UPI001EE5165A|nr:neuronal acetylcholine receptor subunit alpha-5-like [Haliotis rubra]